MPYHPELRTEQAFLNHTLAQRIVTRVENDLSPRLPFMAVSSYDGSIQTKIEDRNPNGVMVTIAAPANWEHALVLFGYQVESHDPILYLAPLAYVPNSETKISFVGIRIDIPDQISAFYVPDRRLPLALQAPVIPSITQRSMRATVAPNIGGDMGPWAGFLKSREFAEAYPQEAPLPTPLDNPFLTPAA